MTTRNRLAKSETPTTKRTAQEWCDFGNRKLIGAEPTVKYHLEAPRHDVHWVVRNGRPTIEWRPDSSPRSKPNGRDPQGLDAKHESGISA